MWSGCRTTTSAIAVALLLSAGPAYAADPPAADAPQSGEQPSDEKPPSKREQARALYQEGVKHAQDAEWAEAYAKFSQAEALYSSPHNVFNIGQCQRALGRYVGALASFRSFLASATDASYAPLREQAGSYVQELDKRVVYLRVATNPPLARVTVNGKPVGNSMLTLDPGHHTIRVERAGYTTRFVDADLKPGERRSETIKLERLPAKLSVAASVERAQVIVSGETVGLAPWSGERPAGSYPVEVVADGYEPYTSTLTVASGESGSITAQLVEETPGLHTRWWFWATVSSVVLTSAVVTYAVTVETPPPVDYDGGSLGWVVTSF